MKKYKLIINYQLLLAFSRLLEVWTAANCSTEDTATRMAWALLMRLLDDRRLRELIRFRFKGDKKVSLKAEETFAVAFMIETVGNYKMGDDMGNFLRTTYGDIHQYFTTINV